MMPGLYIAGIRDKRLVTGALAGSTLITLFLLTFTAVQRGRMQSKQKPELRMRYRRRLAA